jgi:hypothetical protein
MARVTECRFCGQTTCNHDHDKCAEDFGKRIENQILKHNRRTPGSPLPKATREAMKSDQWKWYQDYLGRKEHSENIRSHMQKIKKNVTEAAKKILARPENSKRLSVFNKEFEGRIFDVRVTVETEVSIVPVY